MERRTDWRMADKRIYGWQFRWTELKRTKTLSRFPNGGQELCIQPLRRYELNTLALNLYRMIARNAEQPRTGEIETNKYFFLSVDCISKSNVDVWHTERRIMEAPRFAKHTNVCTRPYSKAIKNMRSIFTAFFTHTEVVRCFVYLTVNHDILLHLKLEHYGTRGLALDWFNFFLTKGTKL